ncbi:MAG: PTS transporter subunit EIIC, partial [Sciscionella sp.]
MTAITERASGGGKSLAVAQRLGRSLMLPIATLPAAGLLNRLGQADLLGNFHNPFMQKVAAVFLAAGGGLFAFLPLLFAVGVAVGFARKSDGSTGVAAAVGFVVFTQVVQVFAPVELDKDAVAQKKYLLDLGVAPGSWPYGVLAGILVGIVTALLWQRFYRIKLPPYLAFFGGRRFVPIITALVMLVLGVLLGLLFPLFDKGITAIGDALTSSTVLGAGAYGVLNRLLIPVGLHQIINSLVWTVFGTYTPNAPGASPVHGDLTRFFAGDPHAGVF